MAAIEESNRVLLVSSSDRFNDALAQLMPKSIYSQVTVARSISAAKRLLIEQDFDLVLVNGPLPDDLGMRFARDAAADTSAAVVLIVSGEISEEISDRMAVQGVAVLPKPVSTREVEQALQFARAMHQRLAHAEQKQVSVEEKIAEIRLVNKAKWLLIDKLGMAEPDAHRLIEKRAMDTRTPKREVAQEIIDSF